MYIISKFQISQVYLVTICFIISKKVMPIVGWREWQTIYSWMDIRSYMNSCQVWPCYTLMGQELLLHVGGGLDMMRWKESSMKGQALWKLKSVVVEGGGLVSHRNWAGIWGGNMHVWHAYTFFKNILCYEQLDEILIGTFKFTKVTYVCSKSTNKQVEGRHFGFYKTYKVATH